jgi:hypothetical protein
MLLDIAQAVGAICGILGSLLVASTNRRHRLAAFSIWLVSNVALGIFYACIGAYWLLGMVAVFTVTSALGVISHRRSAQFSLDDFKVVTNSLWEENGEPRFWSNRGTQVPIEQATLYPINEPVINDVIEGSGPGSTVLPVSVALSIVHSDLKRRNREQVAPAAQSGGHAG